MEDVAIQHAQIPLEVLLVLKKVKVIKLIELELGLVWLLVYWHCYFLSCWFWSSSKEMYFIYFFLFLPFFISFLFYKISLILSSSFFNERKKEVSEQSLIIEKWRRRRNIIEYKIWIVNARIYEYWFCKSD